MSSRGNIHPSQIVGVNASAPDATLYLNQTGWGTPSGGGGGGGGSALVFLERHVAASASEVDFTASIGSSYDVYEVDATGVTVSTNGATVGLQFSSNGGASWIATDYYFGAPNSGIGGAGTGSNGANNISYIPMFSDGGLGGMPNTATKHLTLSGKIFIPSGLWPYFTGTGLAWYYGDGKLYGFTTYGFWGLTSGAATINAFRFIVSSGTMSGAFTCYGRKQS